MQLESLEGIPGKVEFEHKRVRGPVERIVLQGRYEAFQQVI